MIIASQWIRQSKANTQWQRNSHFKAVVLLAGMGVVLLLVEKVDVHKYTYINN